MESLVKKCIFLLITLFVLIAGASAAQFDDDGIDKFAIVDPPDEGGGERIPVFLVMSEQPTVDASVQTMKATAMSQQDMAMCSLAGIDSYAAETAQSYWIVNAIRVEAYPADLDRLAALPGVDHIEPDFTVTVADPVVETMNEMSPDSIVYSTEEDGVVWSADYIGAPSVWDTGNLGEGVNISIVDSGIDGNHPAFGDRIIAWADFVGDRLTAYDDCGHGTHCAGTAAGGVVEMTDGGDTIDVTLGVAPGANLMGAKVLNAGGTGSNSDIIKGVEWSVENGADVISMSLGGFAGPWEPGFSDVKIVDTLNDNNSVEVSIKADPSYYTNWEPQFILGAVYADSSAIDEIVCGGNLSFTVTDASGKTATGDVIDTSSDIYYFRAPYADNEDAWAGDWKATLTNNGGESVDITKIGIATCYQSNGQDQNSVMLNNLMKQGITVVVSAGNSGDFGLGTIGTPGVAEDIITVGATDYMMDYRASFSSMGPVGSSNPYIKPDVVAPGVGIISSYKDGEYAIMNGTSMSTPAVAGAAALMLAGNSSLTPADIKDGLMSSAIHIDENGLVHDTMVMNSAYGAGRVDAYGAVNITTGEQPDFVPSVVAPHELKINRDDTFEVNNLTVSVANVGTADFVYTDTDGVVMAEFNGHSKTIKFTWDILKGEYSDVFRNSVGDSATGYDIDPETPLSPQDVIIKVTVNPEHTIDELRYDNNAIIHNLTVTAPDLVTEIVAPSTTTSQLRLITPIGVNVTNAGEVPSVATTLNYKITNLPWEQDIEITALEPGESTIVWRNQTLAVGDYDISAVVNPGHVTDYETSYTNNEGIKHITSYANAAASIVLPQEEVLIPNSQIELPIVVSDVTELAAYQMTFSYNASVINVTDVVSGDIGGLVGNLKFAKDGYVIFDGVQTRGESGDVTVATLVIDIIGSTDDETTLALSNAELWDINGFSVPVAVTDGSATLLLYGDANADGFVNQADTLKVLKWVVGIDADKPTSGTRLLQTDVTKNSLVDVGDAMFIAQKNAELRDDYFNIL